MSGRGSITRKLMISASALLLLLASLASAETNNISGDITPGLNSVVLDKNSAKFFEYNGLRDGISGDISLGYDSGLYHSSLSGMNIGLDDQYYGLTGGKWGLFSYHLYYNETPHNYSFDARTFYSGIGTNNLNYSYSKVPTDTSLWSTFDYKIKRKDLGVSIELTSKSPFYVMLSANRLERTGLYPIGASSGVFRTVHPGSLPDGLAIEMPAPINDTTTNGGIELGYRTKPLFLSLAGQISTFANQNDWLNFRNPFVTNMALTETISLPPDNKYWKLKFTGSLKLPLDSRLSVNAGHSNVTSEVQLLDSIWTSSAASSTSTPTYSLINLGLSDKTFNGNISHDSLSTVLTSSPVQALFAKVYYKFLKKKNDSDSITYTNTTTDTTATNNLFSYEKNNAGAEVSYRLSKSLKALAGYDYIKTNRHRADIPETRDNAYFAEMSYSPADFLLAKVKYQRLNRSAAFTPTSAPSIDPWYIENYVRKFDAAGKNQDSLKLIIDLSPEHLDLSVEYAYKKDRYTDTTLGVTGSKRNEYILDASCKIKRIKLYGYIDYEDVRSDQTSRYVNPTGAYSFDPNAAPVNNSYNWNVTLKDANFAWGLGAEVPLVAKKLILAAQYAYESSNGNADFTSQVLTGSLTQDSIDTTLYDDYRKQSLSTRLKYDARKNLKFILGYIYERLEYSDAQYQGYQYVVISSSSHPTTYLTGAYLDHSYKANVVYLKTVYTF